MSFLDPLPQGAPKKWIKQEIKRLKKEIQDSHQLLKHHSNLRQSLGLKSSENLKDLKLPPPTSKQDPKEVWGVKLSYSLEVPKKRGRSRKVDQDLSQTRIVFYLNSPNR
jgi:hypothetical protein